MEHEFVLPDTDWRPGEGPLEAGGNTSAQAVQADPDLIN